jgi:hypothetical protein
MIKWLGENGGELVGTKKYLLCAKKRIFVYKLDFFVCFIGDEQVHAQECYGHSKDSPMISLIPSYHFCL